MEAQPRERQASWRVVGITLAAIIGFFAVVLHLVGVPPKGTAAICGIILIVMAISLVANAKGISEAAKALSADRTFLERIRAPDPAFASFLSMLSHVAPFSIGFFWIGIFALRIMAEAAFGPQSWVTFQMDGLLQVIGWILLPGVVGTMVGIWALRAYVAIKLRQGAADRPS